MLPIVSLHLLIPTLLLFFRTPFRIILADAFTLARLAAAFAVARVAASLIVARVATALAVAIVTVAAPIA